MIKDFLTIDGDKLSYTYCPNGFRPEQARPQFKKMTDGRTVHRLEDIVDDDKPTQKPLVIMVHDFPDGRAFLDNDGLADTYATRLGLDGFPTLQFHFRGCGQSDGRQQDFCFDTAVEDLNAIMQWAKDSFNHDRFAIIAAGLGACVVAQAYDPKTICALVLLWPVFKPMDTPLSAIDTRENMTFMAENGYVPMGDNRLGQLLANELRTFDSQPYLAKITTATQIQQGTADTYTPYESTDVIKKYLTGLVDFGVFEDGEHYLPDPVMRKQMVDNTLYFLNRYAFHLPPGRKRAIDTNKIFRHQG